VGELIGRIFGRAFGGLLLGKIVFLLQAMISGSNE